MRVIRVVLVSFAVSALALSPSPAGAQDVQPKLTIAAGAGIATPFHGDFDFTAPNWEVSARGSVAQHVAAEVFYEQWEHDTVNVSQRTTYRMRTMGINALATGGASRLSFFGGGGVGLLAYDRRSVSTFSSDSFTLQGGGRSRRRDRAADTDIRPLPDRGAGPRSGFRT